MRTLLIFRNYRRAQEVAKEFNLTKNEFRYMPSGISSEDVMNHDSTRGEIFSRVIYDRKPSDKAMAYLSICMRDGAIMTNYTHYRLTRLLRKL